MKKFWKALINVTISSYLFLLLFVIRQYDLPYHLSLAWFSTLPIVTIFMNLNSARLTLQEFLHSSFKVRFVSYVMSAVMFLLCLLFSWGLIPFLLFIPGRITTLQRIVHYAILFVLFILVCVNILICIRDTTKRMKGLPV